MEKKELSLIPEFEHPIRGEPWVNLADARELRAWSKEDEIAWNQTHRQREKYKFYVKAFDFLSDNEVAGDYFEFGCHRARTFRMALTEARRHSLSNMTFWAFDSFAGLPHNRGDHLLGDKWQAGELTTSKEEFELIITEFGIYPENVKCIKGFYDQSLSSDLVRDFNERNVRSALVCIDCDLYESAVPVFDFVEHYLTDGTIIYIDDYWTGYKGNPNYGVSLAFKEFVKKSSWQFAEYLPVGAAGKSFVVYR